ncbi:MAG TPA: undecaprenyl-diphosphate phosphatase [Fibrobacteraceae bacterium]|nr:undecaprenyl-diphosphate phosphatase [Fibrobacteraceae bacterium]
MTTKKSLSFSFANFPFMFDAIILGLVEGLTEFLPVSSTGHLLIAQALLKNPQSDAFNIAIQMGPILAVTLVFWKRLVELATGFGNPDTRDEAIKLCASFALTGAAGLVAKKLGLELPESVVPVALATFIGGGVIFWAERRAASRVLSDRITWGVAVAVAAGQVLAMVFPGTSRSGAAVIAALLLGLARPTAVRFAFLVGIPTLLSAGALELKEAIEAGQGPALLAPSALVAFVVATLTAWISVIWLLRFVQTRDFRPFAWYRLGLGTLLLALVGMGFLH